MQATCDPTVISSYIDPTVISLQRVEDSTRLSRARAHQDHVSRAILGPSSSLQAGLRTVPSLNYQQPSEEACSEEGRLVGDVQNGVPAVDYVKTHLSLA